jgi:hypothetical protein
MWLIIKGGASSSPAPRRHWPGHRIGVCRAQATVMVIGNGFITGQTIAVNGGLALS